MDQQAMRELTAKWSPFTSFCEGPEDVEKGFRLFPAFYERNYKKLLPKDLSAEILVISSGPGYFQQYLKNLGYTNVLGIDSDPEKVAIAKDRGYNSECASSFDYLPRTSTYDFIFGEQEVNHLTREEFLELLGKCYESLRPQGKLLLVAANCANPLIATEHPGNNWDHYMFTAEGNLTQAFEHIGFTSVTPMALDFYVLWRNPANYVAKLFTMTFHLILKIIFRMYGKNANIFTKRLAIYGAR